MSADRLTRLFPPAADAVGSLSAEDAYGQFDFAPLARDDRPYVVVNMVATVDGQGRIDGDTSELGDATDQQLFATLREQVDCVMAGVRTVAIENYKAPAAKEETRSRRVARGLAPRPVFVTATRSGELPLGAPLFQDPDARVVVFTAAAPDISQVKASIDLVAHEDPPAMLAHLRHEYGVRSLLLEGGPHINTPFFADELVDELFLTLAPTIVGAATPFPIISGDLPRRQQLHLIGALLANEHLYLRYRVD